MRAAPAQPSALARSLRATASPLHCRARSLALVPCSGTQVLAAPLEQQVGVQPVLQRNCRDRGAGLQAALNQLALECAVMRTACGLGSCVLIGHGVHLLGLVHTNRGAHDRTIVFIQWFDYKRASGGRLRMCAAPSRGCGSLRIARASRSRTRKIPTRRSEACHWSACSCSPTSRLARRRARGPAVASTP